MIDADVVTLSRLQFAVTAQGVDRQLEIGEPGP